MRNGSKWLKRSIRALTVFLCLQQSACGTAAFVRHDGKLDEGTIQKSDERVLVLEDDGGGRQLIPRATVQEIDHPGNVAGLTGAVLATWATLSMYKPSLMGCEGEEAQFCGLQTIPVAIIGFGLAIYGGLTWGSSVNRARPERSGNEKGASLNARPAGND